MLNVRHVNVLASQLHESKDMIRSLQKWLWCRDLKGLKPSMHQSSGTQKVNKLKASIFVQRPVDCGALGFPHDFINVIATVFVQNFMYRNFSHRPGKQIWGQTLAEDQRVAMWLVCDQFVLNTTKTLFIFNFQFNGYLKKAKEKCGNSTHVMPQSYPLPFPPMQHGDACCSG